MDCYQSISERRSVRKFRSQPLPDGALQRILEAGRQAPSWGNKQQWKVCVVQDAAVRAQLNEAANGNPADAYLTAPCVLVLCVLPDAQLTREDKQYYMLDAGIAGEHMVLAAQAEGLGSCWAGWFDETAIARVLGVASPWRVAALIPIGIPDENPEARPRKSLETLVCWEKWTNA